MKVVLCQLLLLASQPVLAQTALGSCGDPATGIARVQGSFAHSPFEGEVVVIEANLGADFRAAPIRGLFIQQAPADQDADPNTSEGLFVYEPPTLMGALSALQVGDRIRVRGTVMEWNDLTELSLVTDLMLCPGATALQPQELQLPLQSIDQPEHLEGMLVRIPQTLTVTGNYALGRYGTLELSSGGRLYQPTQLFLPGAAAQSQLAANDLRRILLDDASAQQDPTPIPYLDAERTRRVGDQLASLTGILDGRYGAYRIQPTEVPSFVRATPRPVTPPPLAGRLRVASLNTLNYFTTLDAGGSACGPTRLACRGANNRDELQRQRAKLVNVLVGLDADIVGLLEVENDAGAAVRDLVDAVNARVGFAAYTFVDTGTIGSDAIKPALIYQPSRVTPVGAFALLTRAVDPRFVDTKHRPVLAQTFEELATHEQFTLALAHLKSKGSGCEDIGDSDQADGQGPCNLTRTDAARAIVAWLASQPTHATDPDMLLLGDLNAYAKEDPLAALQAGGLHSLLDVFAGPSSYSYQFAGQSGSLDHALATLGLAVQVRSATHWHIDADEPSALDYNTEWKSDDPFDASTPFRASDHDPLLLGVDLRARPGSWLPVRKLQDFLDRLQLARQRALTAASR